MSKPKATPQRMMELPYSPVEKDRVIADNPLCEVCGFPIRGNDHDECDTCFCCGRIALQCECDDETWERQFALMDMDDDDEGRNISILGVDVTSHDHAHKHTKIKPGKAPREYIHQHQHFHYDPEVDVMRADHPHRESDHHTAGAHAEGRAWLDKPEGGNTSATTAKPTPPKSTKEGDHHHNDGCDEHYGSGFMVNGHFWYWTEFAKTVLKHGCPPDKTPGYGKEFAPKDSPYGPFSKPSGTSGHGGYGGSWASCTHAWQDFTVNGKTIKVTAARDSAKAPDLPDFGVYLDSGWKSAITRITTPVDGPVPTIETGGGAEFDVSDIKPKPTTVEWLCPAVIVSWPDYGIINLEVAHRLVDLVWAHMAEGKVVETGCQGAHGRTGTFLAMMLIAKEGLDPHTAIEQVRKRLCKRTIESTKQVQAIFAFAGVAIEEKEAEKLKR